MDLQPFRDLMGDLARESGDLILPYFANRNIAVDLKSDDTPVTVADRRAEELLRDLIHRRFPAHGIVGEEFGDDKADAEFVWTLDPIDGTLAFISAVPLFGTLIGLLHEGRPVLGCINQPALQQFLIGDGEETLFNGRPAQTRGTASLAEATLLTSDTTLQAKVMYGAAFEDMARKCRLVRTWGSCFGYSLVATGWADIMLDPSPSLWDKVPVVPVIRGAGGIITDWQGRDPMESRPLLASVPALHDTVIRELNRR